MMVEYDYQQLQEDLMIKTTEDSKARNRMRKRDAAQRWQSREMLVRSKIANFVDHSPWFVVVGAVVFLGLVFISGSI